jgi:hypothetical protein
MSGYKLGKLPARADSIKLKFADYFDMTKVPTPPKVFGRQWMVKKWGMLGNDKYGCCVWAGAAHETMVYTAAGAAGAPAPFSEKSILSDYAAVTGFDPANPDSDQGTDMQKAAAYRKKVGVIDARGKRHVVESYVAPTPGRLSELILSTWLFAATGVGLIMPETAEEQFDAGEPWTVVKGAKEMGGHYVSAVGRNARGNILISTWGKIHEMTPEFYRHYCDEAVTYLSKEALLKNNLTREGFDLASLQSHLAQL